MTEEIKSFKPIKSLDERLPSLSLANLAGEARRVSKNPKSPLDGAIADVLLISFFKQKVNKHDPYLRQKKSRKGDNWGIGLQKVKPQGAKS